MNPGDIVRIRWRSIVINHSVRSRLPDEIGIFIDPAYQTDRGRPLERGCYAQVLFGDGNIDTVNTLALETMNSRD